MNQRQVKYRIGIADSRNSHIYFRSVCEQLDVVLVDDVTAEQIESGMELDLCILTGEYWPEQVFLLVAARAKKIPTLHVMDGILEWRNTWDHSGLIAPLLQPVLADKIACLGNSQRRILESWGNYGKCEVVGSPRLDGLLGHKWKVGGRPEFTLLVTCARTPWFNADQEARVKQGFRDLIVKLKETQVKDGRKLKVIWRLHEDLYAGLFEEESPGNHISDNLAGLLDEADAMITTPSTIMLEGMLCRIPVAILDYTNSPQYVQAAWSITACEQISSVLCELLNPPQARQVLQDYYLHDALECHSPASPRLSNLIEEMLGPDHQRLSDPKDRSLPVSKLAGSREGQHSAETSFDLAKLYPQHSIYSDYDKAALQVELLHSREKIRQLRNEVRLLKAENARSWLQRLSAHSPVINGLWNFYRRLKGKT